MLQSEAPTAATLEPAAPQHAVNPKAGVGEPRKFRPDIEGLRAVAVVAVVLSHLGLSFPGGYIGVDVFFVISGFLITRQLAGEYTATGRVRFLAFYSRRAKRILPAASVVIIATIVACRVWDSPLTVRSDALDGLFSAFSGINWRIAAQGANYFSLGTPPSPFEHFWSLSVEEQFYFVWPALIVAVGWLLGRRLGQLRSLITTLLIISAGSLYLSIETTTSSPTWAYFGSQTRVWELAVGALIAVTIEFWNRLPMVLASLMSWAGLIVIAISCFAFSDSTVYPGSAVVAPVLGSALVIAAGVPGWTGTSELLLKLRPFQFVGNISYSWYLTHWPFLMVLPMALNHALPRADKYFVLGGSFVLAVALYYLVERPIRTRPVLLRQPNLGLTLGGIMVMASVIVALLVAGNTGLPARVDGSSGAQAEVPSGPSGPSGLSGSSGPSAAKSSGPPKATVATIKSLVSAGAKLTVLPATTPTLSAAATDHPKTDICLEPDTVDTLTPDAHCTFGDKTATKTIALVGDSHADQWVPTMSAFGNAYGYKVVEIAKSGCPAGVYPTFVDTLTKRVYSSCNDYKTQLFAHLKVLKPQIVIVADYLRTVAGDPSGLVTAIQNYEASGAHVIFLEDTPDPSKIGSVPACLAKNTTSVQKCALNRFAADTRLDGFAQRKNEAAAAAAAGAIVIDPTDWFCTAATCPPVINGMVVYSDGSRVTATYARWLAPVLEAKLKAAIG
jgi:peptidoglycan/LPS O-acetylase OafA/YrhL